MTVPFAGSLDWYMQWYRGLKQGHAMPPLPKHANRCAIVDGHGGVRLLTVPVVGGGHHLESRLRHRDVALADHGDWRREHYGTWNSLYGRAPYFEHLYSRMHPAYEESATLCELSEAFHAIVIDMLPLDADSLAVPRQVVAEHIPTEQERGLSMMHLLMHRGPEAIFTLMSALINEEIAGCGSAT